MLRYHKEPKKCDGCPNPSHVLIEFGDDYGNVFLVLCPDCQPHFGWSRDMTPEQVGEANQESRDRAERELQAYENWVNDEKAHWAEVAFKQAQDILDEGKEER